MKKVTRLAISLLACVAGQISAKEWPKNDIYGTTFESACAPAQWQLIQSRISELAGQRNPEDLTKLTRTLFCGDGLAATRYLRKHVARKVKVISESTGETKPSHSWNSPSDYSPMNGSAWDAGLGAEGEDVSLQYYPNEACIVAKRLRFSGNQWQIFASSDACD